MTARRNTEATPLPEPLTKDQAWEITELPMPKPLTSAQATVGTIVTLLFDDDGKLYRIDGYHNGDRSKVDLTRQDGRTLYARVGDLQVSNRPFPSLPDYLPKVGEFVTTAKVRGWKDTTPLIVTKFSGMKVTVMVLDGSGRYANVPAAALKPAQVTVTLV